MDKNLSESLDSLMSSIELIQKRTEKIEEKSKETIEKLQKTKIDLMEEIYNPAFNIEKEVQEERQ